MRVAVFDYVPSAILSAVDFPEDVDVLFFREPGDPVEQIHGLRPFPAAVFVAQPPGATTGYAAAARLRDCYPGLRIIAVRTADAQRDRFLAVGADAVIDPAGIDKEISKLRKEREKAAAAAG
ncbi:MAG: hypothetical protein D6729_04300 [Deltaproteobacteria bacterium]|nr:MAG: hypothetical protein D6729_04300 [Deltaproteobacteria bacterium]